jgi:hypothetical protein
MKILKIASRILFFLVLAAIAIPILLGVVKKYVGNNMTPPTVAEAPYLIETTSRIYYGAYFTLDNGTPELKNYWTVEGANYKYHKGIIAFPKISYGTFGKDVILVQRVKQ